MSSPMATLIGDLVGSRAAADRRRVHAALVAAVEEVNRDLHPVTPLRIQAGDEYQGCFATVGEALRATLRLRLVLVPNDVRHGVGWGTVTVLSEEPRIEDGPGWWVAREAIEEVRAAEGRAVSRSLRTAYRRAPGIDGPDEATVNAALITRDALLASAGHQSMSVLAGMLAGMSQQQIAARLGVTPSAVSQRVRRDALGALLRADELLGKAR